MANAEQTLDDLQNKIHAAVDDTLADNAPAIAAVKEYLTDVFSGIKQILDENPNQAGERVVNPNATE